MSTDEKILPAHLRQRKDEGRKITMLSIYDYAIAGLADHAGLDTILVGDSLAMTALGYSNTVSVTLDEMLHHTRAVARAAKRAMVIRCSVAPELCGAFSPGRFLRNNCGAIFV